MKFPSIKILAESAAKTAKRFPFELLFALAGTIAATVLIETNQLSIINEQWCYRVMMMANLGLLLSLGTTLFAESSGFSSKKAYTVRLFSALAALSLLFILNPNVRQEDYLRFFLFSLGFHLLVSFSGFFTYGRINGFWQFNRVIFLRFLTSVLYSGVLFLGLFAAINAANFLFNLKLSPHVDGTLFVWIAGIFNTVFFLAGVPKDLNLLESDSSYPKGLKIFTQYVLIPLATVYVIILLAYEVKILLQWSLPKGLVSSLILGYAVFGILSILLVYPVREQAENKWIKTWARSFYFLLIPLIVLLFLAMITRVLPYGITQPRYFLLLLAIWLSFITMYFLLSKKQNIKIIPITLCFLTLISIYGPISAFKVSVYSQRSKLIGLFEKYGKYKNGKLVPLGSTKMTSKDGTEALAKLYFLSNDENMNDLQGYINKDLSVVSDSLTKASQQRGYNSIYNYALKESKNEWLTNYLGLDKFADNIGEDWVNYSYDDDSNIVLNVKGYDYVTRLVDGFSNTDTTFLKADGIKIKQLSDTLFNCKLFLNNELIVFNLKQVSDSLIKHKSRLRPYTYNRDGNNNQQKDISMPQEMLFVQQQTKSYIVSFEINKLVVNYSKNKVSNVSEIEGYYLIRKKDK